MAGTGARGSRGFARRARPGSVGAWRWAKNSEREQPRKRKGGEAPNEWRGEEGLQGRYRRGRDTDSTLLLLK